MKEKSAQGGIVERVPYRIRKPFALAASIGALAAPAAFVHSAEASPPMRYAGIVSNDIWVPDKKIAEDNAKKIADLGANAVRIFQPYTRYQAAEINNDKDRLCNAAEAARDNGLTFFITMLGFNPKEGKRKAHVGYAPLRMSGWRRFSDTVSTVMWTLAGPNGCAKDVPDLNIGLFNEVNSPRFYPGTAEQYESMLEYTYPRLKAEAGKITASLQQQALHEGHDPNSVRPVTVNVIGGELASSHNLLPFLKDMGEAKIAHGYVGPIFDTLATHPYNEKSSVSPDTVHPGGTIVGLADYNQLEPLVNKYFGNVPIFYDEFGVESRTPPNKGYVGRTPASVQPVSEVVQGEYISQAYALAACEEGVDGLMTFGLHDEPNLARWQAAPYDKNGLPKLSLPAWQQALTSARAGTISNC